MSSKGKADYVIQEVAGCGPFHVALIFVIHFVTKCVVMYTMMFMAFGIYNPGWRCLDDNTTITLVVSNTTPSNVSDRTLDVQAEGKISKELLFYDNCTLFESCQNIEFDPHTSTIVSEWGLLCDKAWIPPLIISVQMVGVLVGCSLAGQLGDTIGRKATIYGSQVALIVLSTVTFFSTSWQMFAALLFFLGMSCASLLALFHVFISEFVTLKWRAAVSSLPSWSILGISYGIVIMLLKNWRHIYIVTVVVAVVGFLPVFWVPESLRWLEVKHKTDRFMKVALKVTKMNGKKLPSKDVLQSLTSEQANYVENQSMYTLLDLFRPGYRMYSIVLGLQWLTCSLWYYSISFGVKSMYGDFYLNVIIMSACEIPVQLFSFLAPDLLGRKLSSVAFISVITVCFFFATGFRLSSLVQLQTVGSTVLIVIVKCFVLGYWLVMVAHTAEIYPTVVRSLGQNWGSLMARLGGTVAPFLIPKDPDTIFICYAVMGVMGLICCVAVFQLPETKGKLLKETFDDNDMSLEA